MTKFEIRQMREEQMQHDDVRTLHLMAKRRDSFICQNFGEARKTLRLSEHIFEACEDPTSKDIPKHAHHLRYPPIEIHLRETPLGDLITLCAHCHGNYHRSPEDYMVQSTMFETFKMEIRSQSEAIEKIKKVQMRHAKELRELRLRGKSV